MQVGSGHLFILAYSLIPWFGVMAMGFGFGEILNHDRPRRVRTVAALGLIACLAFVLLRSLNIYGDSIPWARQDTLVKTTLSFFNCQKYPPSLIYLAMTLGPGLLIMAAFDYFETGPSNGPITSTFINLGRAPLLYYLLQWPLIHLLTNFAAYVAGKEIPWNAFPFEYPPGYGFSLPVVYGMWLLTVTILYFPTRWFAAYKRQHRSSIWLSYL